MTKLCLNCQEKPARSSKAWYCEECVVTVRRDYLDRWLKENRKLHNKLNRRSVLLNKYDLTEDDYATILRHAEGRCDLCGVEGGESLCIDHDHKTGQVRGLLCHRCNLALGYFRDDINVMGKAIDYIKVNMAS